MARLDPNRFSWNKRTSASTAEDWFETLAHLGPQRVMITELAGSKSAQVQAHGLTSREAESLKKQFGGSTREARWLTAQNPPQRAPIKIRGKLSVVSTQNEREKAIEAGDPPALWIPAGMAFGTGEHSTTSMCLRQLADVASLLKNTPWEFLDLGTGSAILAMAARILGAKNVLGTDFDPHAIRTAKENVANNALKGIKLINSDVLKWTPERTWPVVAANLFSGVLIEAAATITSAIEVHGHLILSGVLREQEAEVLKAFEKQGVRFERIVRKGKWISARGIREVREAAKRSKQR
ncbi:MAG: 50S ribosomal protein L11 methyltransferase [Verrucomicrobiota bacterium]